MGNLLIASDEELILSSRAGHSEAKNELDKPYCSNSEKHAKWLFPAIYKWANKGDINHAAFSTYLRCYDGYVPGHSTFFSYYAISIIHTFIRLMDENFKKGGSYISLDGPFDEDRDLTYYDVIMVSNSSDPRQNINFLEAADALEKARSNVTHLVSEVARLNFEGLSFGAISKRLHISKKTAWAHFQYFKRCVRRSAAGYDIKNESQEVIGRRIEAVISFSKRKRGNPEKDPLPLVSFKKGIPYRKPDSHEVYEA